MNSLPLKGSISKYHNTKMQISTHESGSKEILSLQQMTSLGVLKDSAFHRLYCLEFCQLLSRVSLQPHGLQPTRLLCQQNSPGKNTGVGCHFLLQEISPTQGSNQGLPHNRQILYPLSHLGSSLSRIRQSIALCRYYYKNENPSEWHSTELCPALIQLLLWKSKVPLSRLTL